MTIQEQRGGRRVVEFAPRSHALQRSQKSQKPKGWSHQGDLARAKGKTIVLRTGDETVTGEVVDADQFTIKLRDLETGLTVIFFKSAITYIRIAA